MTVKTKKTARKWVSAAALVCLLSIAGCLGSGTSFLEDTGLSEPLPAPLTPDLSADLSTEPPTELADNSPSSTTDELYSNLPTGPSDTGTYPDISSDPEARILAETGEDLEVLTNQMNALADAHEAGRISTAAYNRRLAYLRNLARNHSADMLAQIGEPAN